MANQGLPFDDDDEGGASPSSRPPLTVGELTAELKRLVEGAFFGLAVVGEVSNCRQWSSGHVYLTLKDDRAQIRAVVFRATARALTFRLEDGLRVIVRGRVSVYDAKGEYQIICDSVEPHGLGARQAAFEQLKRRLQAEGLFEAARKRPLPVLPRRIGVVTSLDGAAVRDILRVLTARHPGAQIVVRPTRVQGDGAALDLVRGLRAICGVPDVDVVIIGRGGGSAEDLWAFNDEALARAIAQCRVPVIAAIGHEIDFTIADFVADVRAATPSNAAELVVDRADNFRARIDRGERRLRAAIAIGAARRRQRVDRTDGRLRHWPTVVALRGRDADQLGLRLRHAMDARIGRRRQHLEQQRARLARQDVHRLLARLRTRAVAAAGRLVDLATRRRLQAAARAGALAARLDALSPLAVLGRGYAICWNAAGTGIIRSARDAAPGDRVRVTLHEGELGCRVESTADARTPHA